MKQLVICVAILFGVTVDGTAAFAEMAVDREGAWGVGLGVGPNLPSPVDAVEDELGSDIGFAGWVRYHVSKRWQLALHFERLEFKKQATSLKPSAHTSSSRHSDQALAKEKVSRVNNEMTYMVCSSFRSCC